MLKKLLLSYCFRTYISNKNTKIYKKKKSIFSWKFYAISPLYL